MASPPAAAQELSVLLAEFAQPIREVFKIEDVPVESFKISLDRNQMTPCKQTSAAGAGAGYALSSPGLFPARSGEGNCLGVSERPVTQDTGQDWTGRGRPFLLKEKHPQHSLVRVFSSF